MGGKIKAETDMPSKMIYRIVEKTAEEVAREREAELDAGADFFCVRKL